MLFRQFQHGQRLFTRNARKTFQKIFQCFTAYQIIKQSFDWHTGARKAKFTAQSLGIHQITSVVASTVRPVSIFITPIDYTTILHSSPHPVLPSPRHPVTPSSTPRLIPHHLQVNDLRDFKSRRRHPWHRAEP